MKVSEIDAKLLGPGRVPIASEIFQESGRRVVVVIGASRNSVQNFSYVVRTYGQFVACGSPRPLMHVAWEAYRSAIWALKGNSLYDSAALTFVPTSHRPTGDLRECLRGRRPQAAAAA